MAEQEQHRGWEQIHQLMFDYLKHLGYDDTVVEEFKNRCLYANYPYFKPLEDWIFFPTSSPNSSSGTVPYGEVNTLDPTKINTLVSGEVSLGEESGKVTSNETTDAPIASSSVSAVDIPNELVDPDNSPNRSSGTVRYGKVNTIDPTKFDALVSGAVSLGEEFGKVTSNETTGAPLGSSSVSAVDIPHELVDPDNFPNRSSGTVRYGEARLSEEFGQVTSNQATSAPLASPVDIPPDIPFDIPPDFEIPYELLDPKQLHRFEELLGSPPRPSDPSLN